MPSDDTSKQAKGSGGNPPADDLAAKVAAMQNEDSKVLELQKKIEELTEQLKKHSETASRAQAELGNAKIRLEKEAMDMRKFAAESVLLRFLPTIDNLQRALKALPKDMEASERACPELVEWVKGIVALEQAFLKEVGDLGLRRFESLGKVLDASRHEVLMQGPGEVGKVVEVLEDGYELHGKVVRPAKVKVGEGTQKS